MIPVELEPEKIEKPAILLSAPGAVHEEHLPVALELQVQLSFEVVRYHFSDHMKLSFAGTEQNHIVHEANIVSDAVFFFDLMIQFCQYEIREPVRRDKAERYACSGGSDYLSQILKITVVPNMFSQGLKQNVLIDAVKELSYVDFQTVFCVLMMIIDPLSDDLHARVQPLAGYACIRVLIHTFRHDRDQHVCDGVMHYHFPD